MDSLTQLEVERNKNIQDLSSNEAILNGKKDELRTLTANLESYFSQREQLRAADERTKSELESINRQVSELETKILTLKQSNDSLQKESTGFFAFLRGRKKENKAQIEDQSKQIQEAEKQIGLLTAHRDNISKSSSQEAIDNVEKEILSLQTGIETLEKDISYLENSISEIKPSLNLEEYNNFMGIISFPEFETEYFIPDLNEKYVNAALASFDTNSQRHSLILPSCGVVPKFLLFHELTHIYDMESYKTGDRSYDFCLTGYMEYHASQVELMVLMEANKITDTLSFSMNSSINCLNCSVMQYIENKLKIASDLIMDDKQEQRLRGMGVFYNFLGLRSVCLMYASDYTDVFSYRIIADKLGIYLLSTMKKFMTGWDIDIKASVALYSNAIKALI